MRWDTMTRCTKIVNMANFLPAWGSSLRCQQTWLIHFVAKSKMRRLITLSWTVWSCRRQWIKTLKTIKQRNKMSTKDTNNHRTLITLHVKLQSCRQVVNPSVKVWKFKPGSQFSSSQRAELCWVNQDRRNKVNRWDSFIWLSAYWTRVRCTESRSRSDYTADREASAMLCSVEPEPSGPERREQSCSNYFQPETLLCFLFWYHSRAQGGNTAACTRLPHSVPAGWDNNLRFVITITQGVVLSSCVLE